MKTKDGITLISLIITVIIMIVLAGVAVSAIMSENGIFERTYRVAKEYKASQILETVKIAKTYLYMNTATNAAKINIVDLIEKIKEISDINDKNYTITVDEENQTARIVDKKTGAIVDVSLDNIVNDWNDVEEDKFPVIVEVSTLGVKVMENAEDENVGVEYYFSTDNGITWDSNSDKTQSVYQYGTDKLNNIGNIKMKKITSTGDEQIASASEWRIDYIGTEQSLIIPKKGRYKLETWGAQGGKNGGYGGYSKGIINLDEGETLYINVGGAGNSNASNAYNGGGAGNGGGYSGDGGGASHIAKSSGVLADLEDKIDSILIVAGGGGGMSESGNLGGSGRWIYWWRRCR